MTTLPATDGILRYTDAEEFRTVPPGGWWPDDVDDFHDFLTDQVHTHGERALDAYVHFKKPGTDVWATAVRLSDCPWGAAPGTPAWVLYIDDDGDRTVIEYPSEDRAMTALLDHVAAREQAGRAYDFVVDPRQPRTALPPGWPSPIARTDPLAPRTK